MGEAEWEVQDGERILGPYSEEQILGVIAKGGLPTTTPVRLVGAETWSPIGTREPFVVAYRARSGAADTPSAMAPAPATLGRLIACPDCGNDVSPLAAACPKCGRPTPKVEADAKQKQRNALVLLAIVLAVGLWSFRSLYRSMTGADVIGTTCTLRVGSSFDAKVPLSKTSEKANRLYGAGLLGSVTERDFEGVELVPAGTSARIEQKDGLTYRVTTIHGSGWVATGMCKP